MSFPTWSDLSRALPYQRPSEAKLASFTRGNELVLQLAMDILPGTREAIYPVPHEVRGPTPREVGESVERFAALAGDLFPVAHPDVTTAFRLLQEVRMIGTRAAGGAAAFQPAAYAPALSGALVRLDVAIQAAIFSQPEVTG